MLTTKDTSICWEKRKPRRRDNATFRRRCERIAIEQGGATFLCNSMNSTHTKDWDWPTTLIIPNTLHNQWQSLQCIIIDNGSSENIVFSKACAST